MFYRSALASLSALAIATLCTAQTELPQPSDLAALGTAWEISQHASADLSFYKAPSNFSSDLEPGTVLKTEYATNLTNYTVPSGLSMSRIIYTTKDALGGVIPASAYILWPYNALPENDTVGYPIAAWTHGTSGLFPPCAPSNYRSLQYHFMIPYLLALQGIVVVAPDYAGLGVGSLPNGERIQHQWATSPAQANDNAFAIEAARSAFPAQLSKDGPFVALGHSEGGRAAWGFAERQVHEPVAGYRGTIAFAPVGDAIAQIEEALQNPMAPWSPFSQGLQPMLIDAITTVYPSYKRRGLTDAAAALFDGLYEPSQGCLPTQSLLLSGLPLDQLARPNWTDDLEVRKWQNLTAVGRKEVAGPLLVLHGASDSIIPYNDSVSSAVLSTIQDTCQSMEDEGWSASIELIGHPGIDHFSVIQASQSRWLGWAKDRLSDTSPPPPQGCAIGEAVGFSTAFTAHAGPAPNFLVEWVNQTYAWQYSL